MSLWQAAESHSYSSLTLKKSSDNATTVNMQALHTVMYILSVVIAYFDTCSFNLLSHLCGIFLISIHKGSNSCVLSSA